MRYLGGSCLCGKVTLEVVDQFQFLGYCHCRECRKWSGSAFSAGGMVDFADLHIIDGQELIRHYPKTLETDLGFCSNCGSSLYSRKNSRGKYVVRLGILDDTPTQRPQAHIFTAERAPWHDMDADLPAYETRPG